MIPQPPPLPKRKVSYTHVTKVTNKRKTFKDRNRSLNPDSRIMGSSGQVSTSKEMDLRPYWNDQVKEWSQKLWLPTVTDSADSHLTSLNLCSHYTLQDLWFSSTNQVPTNMKYHKISLQSTPSLSVEYKEEDQLCTEESGKPKTIKARSKKK